MKTEQHVSQGFAIVRVDVVEDVQRETDWNNRVTVKKIVWDVDAAEREVRRLTEINAGKGCVYFWQTTRVEPKEGTRRVFPPS